MAIVIWPLLFQNGYFKWLCHSEYVNVQTLADCSRKPVLLRRGNPDIGFDVYRKIHRIGNKAFFVGVMM